MIHQPGWPGRAGFKARDLAILSDECAQGGAPIPTPRDQLSSLSYRAARAPYPGETPTTDEAREAVTIAQEVRRFARRTLGLPR